MNARAVWERVRRPIVRALHLWRPPADPWLKLTDPILMQAFGPGSKHEPQWYLSGVSAVHVESVAEIHRWLRACSYRSDPSLFQEPDFWQHPLTLEQIRRGDCEDFALWAWRKLLELGVDADFVCGESQPRSVAGSLLVGQHAWVVFRQRGEEFLYETTVKDFDEAIHPLELVARRYVPNYGVGRDLRPFRYAGHYLSMRERIFRPERPVLE